PRAELATPPPRLKPAPRPLQIGRQRLKFDCAHSDPPRGGPQRYQTRQKDSGSLAGSTRLDRLIHDSQRPARVDIPDLGLAVAAAGDQPLAVRRERHAANARTPEIFNGRRMAGEHPERLAGSCVPDSYFPVASPGRHDLSVAR